MDQAASDYVLKARQMGFPDAEIKASLLGAGWPQYLVDPFFLPSNPKETLFLSAEKEATANPEPAKPSAFTLPPAGQTDKKPQAGSQSLLIGSIAVLLVIAAGAGFYYWQNRASLNPLSLPTPVSSTTIPPENPATPITASIQLTPPEGWIQDTSGASGALLVFAAAEPEILGQAKWTPRLSVTEESDLSVDLDSYIDTLSADLGNQLPDYAETKREDTTVAGFPSKQLTAKFTDGTLTILTQTTVILHSQTASLITAAAPEAAWGKYESSFTTALNSIKFTE